MKKLNLLPPELQKLHKTRVKNILIKGLIATVLLALVVVLGIGNYQLITMEKQVEQLKAQRQQLLPFHADKEKLEKQLGELQVQSKEINEVVPKGIMVGNFLGQISKAIPDDVWMKNLNIIVKKEKDGEQEKKPERELELILEGYSHSVNSAGFFSYYLSHIPEISQVVIDYSAATEIESIPVVEFRIKGRISL